MLFRKGDLSSDMFYTLTGRYRLNEIGQEVGPGQVIGEIGLIAPDNKRTLTFECIEDGDLLTISYDHVKELYFQNPEFGFYFLQLISQRLFKDIDRLQERGLPIQTGACEFLWALAGADARRLASLRLLNWEFRVHDGRGHAIHMIFVAQQTVLTRHAAGVTGLAEILFHRAEIGRRKFAGCPARSSSDRGGLFRDYGRSDSRDSP